MATSTNQLHEESLSQKDRIVIWITDRVGTIECAILFAAIGIASIVGILTGNYILGVALGAFSSYFLQLVMLPLISIRQNLDQRHAEFLAEVTYESTIKDEVNTEEIISKLDEILEIIAKGKKK